jgi:hypothetical protein
VNDEPLDETQERLLRRMRAADPAQQATPAASSWIPDLVEATMSTDLEPTTRARRWVPALAAAAVVAVIAGGAYAVLDDDEPSARRPAPTATSLALPGGGDGASMSSCIQFDVAFLRDMQVAFSGTATEVGGDTVTLEVDRWYKGGDADVVQLANFDPTNTSLDGFTFEQGDRYLISASDGTVSFCGFSGPWSEELAGAFDEAFGS